MVLILNSRDSDTPCLFFRSIFVARLRNGVYFAEAANLWLISANKFSLSPSCEILDRKAILQRERRNIPDCGEMKSNCRIEIRLLQVEITAKFRHFRRLLYVRLLTNMSLLKTQIATRQDTRLRCTTFPGLLLLNAKAGGMNVGGRYIQVQQNNILKAPTPSHLP